MYHLAKEWEELILFASHYFILYASTENRTDPVEIPTANVEISLPINTISNLEKQSAHSRSRSDGLPNTHRRFGAIFETDQGVFGHYGGSTEMPRASSTDYWFPNDEAQPLQTAPSEDIGSRLCHTITTLNPNFDCVLVGGRRSPDKALKDCWLRRSGIWERTDDLPVPLYRHSTTLVTTESGKNGVLVFGGKSDNGIPSNVWFLWQDDTGWVKVDCPDIKLRPRFGASMISHNKTSRGLLVSLSLQLSSFMMT